jgi:hypothetical protein
MHPDNRHHIGAVCRYFAYGSNMNPLRVQARGLRAVGMRGARLHDVRLTFDKSAADHPNSGHAALAYAPGESVEGVLYDLAEPAEILKMDLYERTPINYSRELVHLTLAGTVVPGWTYFANRAVLRRGLRPSRSYLGHLLAGAPYLSASYLSGLKAITCVDD